jgi:release factor glutamine methyltransferase
VRARDLLSRAREQLARAGVADDDLDAELLLRHVTGWDRAALLAQLDRDVATAEAEAFDAAVARRAAREPLQYVTGLQWFWKSEFVVSPAVLIPRPETEGLVELALQLLRDVRDPVVTDVGTGSGCIAVSLALERPDAAVHATDVSRAALDVAAQNARRLGARVHFHEADLLAGAASWAPACDLILSNPPYVDRSDPRLMPEVRDHEPAVALFPPGDALFYFRRLARDAAPYLTPGGGIAFEVGAGQAAAVSDLLRAEGYEHIAAHDDLRGIPRVLGARRR